MNSTTLQYQSIRLPVITARTQAHPPAEETPEMDARSSLSTTSLPSREVSATGQNVRWLSYVDKRLGALSNRPEVLDEPEDYPKPPAETIVRARTIAWGYFAALTPTPNVVPSVEGGVDFVWYKGDWHLKIKVGVEGVSVWAHNLSTGDLWAGPLDENSEKLRRLLVELAGVR